MILPQIASTLTLRSACSESEKLFLEKLDETIQKRLTDPQFGVAQLASLLNLSRAHLTRKATHLLKCAPGKYILSKRLSLATILLTDGKEAVKNVSSMVGFQNYSSFWRAFNKEFNCSPTDYAPRRNLENAVVLWAIPPTAVMRQRLPGVISQNPRIAELFRIVLRDIGNEDLTLTHLADALCIGPSQLLRDLKSSLHVTPIRLLLHLRLLYAAELLGDSDLSIGEIAHKAGFFDQAHLSRAFKVVFGRPPSAYKRENHQEGFLLWLKNHLIQQNAML